MWLFPYRPSVQKLRELRESDAIESVEVVAKGKKLLTVSRLNSNEEQIALRTRQKNFAGLSVGQRGWRHFSRRNRDLSTFVARSDHEKALFVIGPARTKWSGGYWF